MCYVFLRKFVAIKHGSHASKKKSQTYGKKVVKASVQFDRETMTIEKYIIA